MAELVRGKLGLGEQEQEQPDALPRRAMRCSGLARLASAQHGWRALVLLLSMNFDDGVLLDALMEGAASRMLRKDRPWWMLAGAAARTSIGSYEHEAEAEATGGEEGELMVGASRLEWGVVRRNGMECDVNALLLGGCFPPHHQCGLR